MESLLFLIRKIGRASTNPINKAINNGYCTLNPENSKIYNPIKETIKETKIRVASAFNTHLNCQLNPLNELVFFSPILLVSDILFDLIYKFYLHK